MLVVARDNLSKQAEARALSTATAASVAKYIYKDVIYRYGYPRKIIVNSGSKNLGIIQELLERYNIKRV